MNLDPEAQAAAENEFRDFTVSDAKTAIQRLKADPGYWKKKNDFQEPGFALANASWVTLHRIAYPEPPPEIK